jgi:hypothetical protein
MHRSFSLSSVSTHLVSKDFCIETPEEDQFLIKICRIYKDNKGLCLTEIYFFTYLYTHEGMADIQLMYNLIPIPCNSGASSIPLCYVLFPATLLHRPFFPSISWHTPQSCCSQIHIQYSLGNSIFFHSLYMSKPA